MPKPVNPGASEAAEYVLGLLGKEDSRAFAQRLKSDEALRAQVEYWEGMFSSLPGEEAEPPPAGMFEKILDRIEGEGADLPGTLTRRESRANWFEISPGIKGRLLHVDRAQSRQYLIGWHQFIYPTFAIRTQSRCVTTISLRRSQPGRRLRWRRLIAGRRDVVCTSSGLDRHWAFRRSGHQFQSKMRQQNRGWVLG
jgi:hypothetical protein